MAFNGCVTNIIEYNTTKTMPVSVSARHIPIKNLKRTISCSSVYIKASLAGFTDSSFFSLSNTLIYNLLLLGVVI